MGTHGTNSNQDYAYLETVSRLTTRPDYLQCD